MHAQGAAMVCGIRAQNLLLGTPRFLNTEAKDIFVSLKKSDKIWKQRTVLVVVKKAEDQYQTLLPLKVDHALIFFSEKYLNAFWVVNLPPLTLSVKTFSIKNPQILLMLHQTILHDLKIVFKTSLLS